MKLLEWFPVVAILGGIQVGKTTLAKMAPLVYYRLNVAVKYGSTVKRSSLKSLVAFVKDNKLPMGMIINQSEQVEWLTAEIVQVPVGDTRNPAPYFMQKVK